MCSSPALRPRRSTLCMLWPITGSEEFCDQFVKTKVTEWQQELTLMAKVATSQPHATFAAFIHGYVHKFTYLSRTTPIQDHLLQPLEDVIRTQLIPAWTGRAPPNDLERELFALPARLGGLGITNPVSRVSKEYQASGSISAPLCQLIESQQPDYPWESLDAQARAKQTIRKKRLEDSKDRRGQYPFRPQRITKTRIGPGPREGCLYLVDISPVGGVWLLTP